MDILTRAFDYIGSKTEAFWNKCGAVERFILWFAVTVFFLYGAYLFGEAKNLPPTLRNIAGIVFFIFGIGLLCVPVALFINLIHIPHTQTTNPFNSPLMQIVIEHNLPIPPQHIQDLINTTYDALRTRPIPPSPSNDPEWLTAHQKLPKEIDYAINKSMTAYLKALPPFIDAPLTTPFVEQVDFPNLSYEMLQPFRLPLLKVFNLFTDIDQIFMQNAQALHFTLPPSQVPRDKRLIMPQTYKADNTTRANTFFRNHHFKPLFDIQAPFPIYDEHRFAHTWIVGRQRSGKTNLLSAMIWDDLQRMAAGECSIFLMDSQENERFLKGLVRLKQFAPGGEWHDKLVYIEPDLQWTPALNPLHVGDLSRLSDNDRYEVIETAKVVIKSFFASLKIDMTGMQGTFFDFLIPATTAIPEPTLLKMQELLEPGGYAKYESDIRKAPPYISRFFATRFRPRQKGERADEYTDTRYEVHRRIEALFSDEFFARSFTHPDNKINLFDLLNEPRIVVINTRKSLLKEDRTTQFGRMFIAQLILSMMKRATIPNPLPCFAYIDECQDYIKDDHTLASIIFQARKQKIAMTLANQDLSQIDDPKVKAALQKAEVQFTPTSHFQWHLAIDPANIKTFVTPLLTDFSDHERFPKMTDREWQAIRREQQERFCIQHRKTETKEAPPREWGKW